MITEQGEQVRVDLKRIYDALRAHPQQNKVTRILKLMEESGEVAEAVIGTAGANKRKGQTHTDLDIADELADVAITAVVAMFDYLPYPMDYLEKKIASVAWRTRVHGS